MNIDILIDMLSRAVARDDSIESWCTYTYGHRHKVYVNIDERQPPAAADCPYIALMPAAKRTGQDINRRNHTIDVACVLHDEESRVHADINIVEYLGVSRLEQLRKLAETAAFGALTGNLDLSLLEIEYDTISMFPYLLAWMALQITEPVLIGTDPFE